MLDDDKDTTSTQGVTGAEGDSGPAERAKPVVKKTTRKAAAKRTTKKAAAPSAEALGAADVAPESPPAGEPAAAEPAPPAGAEPAKPVVKKSTRKAAAKRTTKKAVAPSAEAPPAAETAGEVAAEEQAQEPAAPARKRTSRSRPTLAPATDDAADAAPAEAGAAATGDAAAADETPSGAGAAVLFQAPETSPAARRTRKRAAAPEPADADAATEESATSDAQAEAEDAAEGTTSQTNRSRSASRTRSTTRKAPVEAAADLEGPTEEGPGEDTEDATEQGDTEDADGTPSRRRRRRGGRRRRKSGDGNGSAEDADDADEEPGSDDSDAGDTGEGTGEGTSRRRRRRRRAGEEGADNAADDPNTVTRVRKGRTAEDQITAVSGSTRLEAKKQRRREGREAGRRRAPIVSEAEFLARRESVERTMVIRQRQDLTQIAVLEDKVLVEHYVARESQTSLIGNVYLGRVQNVLPSMEAAFIDIGKGRNAVLYAGEVNWSALGHKDGQPRKIESVLQSGQSVLVQVTKDPIGHKGARLTSQISLAGRFLVYVPDGTTSGISRKLPDTERNRLKTLLKEIVPDSAGVIVRTAAEGASEEELTRDVQRLKARWEDVEKKAKGSAPQLLYGEPDLTLKVVRDLFTEDFTKLVIEGEDAWETVRGYVEHVAPDLVDRVQRFERPTEGKDSGKDVFGVHRIEEQIHKGLDRKVWLPSGGSLIIDRTEAMTVVDVNTGKFTGSGGNLEETVTKNNLEAAEEIVRQLRLRDIGGIIVVDFIDMVLESNRDLVVRRLVECLGRDRTRHQVAEVTSLGLVQMTRKRIGTGLLEAFSENCEHCHGRGVVIKDAPVDPSRSDDDEGRRGGRRGRGRKGNQNGSDNNGSTQQSAASPSPKDIAAMARPDKQADAVESEPVEGGAPSADEVDPAKDDAAAGEGPEQGSGRKRARARKQDTAQEPELVQDAATEAAAEPQKSQPELAAPADAEASEAAEPAPPAPPVKPQVVTRTRRRSASRPAGPPITPPLGVTGTQPESGLVEPGTASVEPGADTPMATEPPHVEHVPIKKKGSRKR